MDDEDELEEGEDDGEAEDAPPPVAEVGETRVAPSTDGTVINVLTPPTTILVTVRRDFPLRQGERLGEWRWSSADGSVNQAPQRWSLPASAGGSPAPDVELEADHDRPIIGWGIGRTAVGDPGSRGGQKTTDSGEVVAARVRLLDDAGIELSAGECRGRHGEVRLATFRRTGAFTIDVAPEHLATGPAGPGMRSEHELLYRAFTVTVRLQDGLLVGVDDPYDPPHEVTHVRVGNHHTWSPTTSHLPLSVKPEWWRDPIAWPRARGAAVNMLVLHCTGGARPGQALNTFFTTRPNTPEHGAAGASYLLDVDGHLIKLLADDMVKVHAGAARWGAERDITNHSFGVEIVNPNKGEPDEYMARAAPPYTEEQYATILRLSREVTAAYPAVGHRIIGHCDIATGPNESPEDADEGAADGEVVPRDSYGTKRNWDPGLHFEWERLEVEGLGMVGGSTFDLGTSYAGVFGSIPGLVLREGDYDAHGSRPARYGGEPRPELPADAGVIEQLQSDLRAVGYSLRITGTFDHRTFAACDRFRRHFLRTGAGRSMRGDIDRTVAARIKNVADALR